MVFFKFIVSFVNAGYWWFFLFFLIYFFYFLVDFSFAEGAACCVSIDQFHLKSECKAAITFLLVYSVFIVRSEVWRTSRWT